jgi:hypothetical protein
MGSEFFMVMLVVNFKWKEAAAFFRGKKQLPSFGERNVNCLCNGSLVLRDQTRRNSMKEKHPLMRRNETKYV